MKGLQTEKEGRDGGMRGKPQGMADGEEGAAMVGECVCLCVFLGEFCVKSIHAPLNGILSPSLWFFLFHIFSSPH